MLPHTDNTRLSVMCEDYNVVEGPPSKSGKKKVTLEGTALIFGRPTRNKVSYTLDSAKNTLSTWIGRPFLNSHDDSNVLNSIGHLEDMTIGKDKFGRDAMFYKVDVDPEEKDYIRKAKRKDIPFVSIQVLVSDVRQKEDINFGQYIEADIKEGLELSSVLIPGDWETNGTVSEQKFAERFFGKTTYEQITDAIKKDKEEETPLKRKKNVGMVAKPQFEEDISTTTGGALVQTPALGKAVKKLPEEPEEEPKVKITPDKIPGAMISQSSVDIDDVLSKKTNEPDETQEEQEMEFTYDKKTIPYYKKGGNNIPAPIPKGVKIEGHSIWKHCNRPMIVAKNSTNGTILYCLSCGKAMTENKKFWKESSNKIRKKYEFIKTTRVLRRR